MEALHKVTLFNAQKREELSRTQHNWLAEVGLGPSYKTRAHDERRPLTSKSSGSVKQIVGHYGVSPRKKACFEELVPDLKAEIQTEGIESLSDSFLSLATLGEREIHLLGQSEMLSLEKGFLVGQSDANEASFRRCRRWWKKEARHQPDGDGKKISIAFLVMQGQSSRGASRGQSSKSHRDFLLAEEAGRIMPPSRH